METNCGEDCSPFIPEIESDIRILKSQLVSLKDKLQHTTNEFISLHSDVFKETPKEDSETNEVESPKNKIVELGSIVQSCEELDDKLRRVYSDFHKLLN